jgi:tetratricopeptide (TPR) repeat protein
MVKRLFITYSTVDRAIAEKVRDQLAEAGYELWIAHQDIKGAVDWTQTILDTIESRDGMVLVWSESAAESSIVREEISIARVFLKPIFPIHANTMKEVPSLPNEINSLQVIHAGSLDLNIAELKKRLSGFDKSDIKSLELAENGFIPKAPNPYFVGRNRELKDLFVDTRGFRGITRRGIPIVISGLAGIGKTQLALTFGYQFNLFFPEGVYWVDATNGIVHEFGKIGSHLGVKRLQDEHPNDYAIRVLEKLNQLRKGLIIFDNVTSFSEFRQWCPTGNTSCCVILTTRLSPRGFPARVMNLTELDSDSAYAMLIARRKDRAEIEHDEAQLDALKELCRITGNHPLALELIASRLQSGYIKPTDYLQRLQPDALSRLSDETENDVFFGVRAARLLDVLHDSYASLDKKLVDRYFLLMCCFAPHGVNEELIVHAYGDSAEGREVLERLAAVSLIRRERSSTLVLHPLVAQFGRAMQKAGNVDYSSKFVEVMLGFLRAHENHLISDDVRREKPHIDEALRVAQDNKLWEAFATLHEYEAVIESGIQERIDSLNKAYQVIEQHLSQQKRRLLSLRLRLGKAYRTAGQLQEALADFNKAEDLYREIKDVDPAEAASLRFELGDTYLALGRYAEAEKTLSDALDMALTYLDNSAPEVLQVRQALARRALYLGDHNTAEVGFTEILGFRKKFYNAQPNATSDAGLASAYADMSRLALARAHYADAIQAANEALTITKEYHDDSDTECSHLYLLLGTILHEAGDYAQAEERLAKAYRDFLTVSGEWHPSYARALMALGEVHRKQGKFDKAEVEVERAIAIFERVYGHSHPFAAEALEVQGMIFEHLGEFDQEQLVWERILEIQHQFYSEEHPALATTHYNYASLFLRRGQYDEAAEHLQLALRIMEQRLGKNHPYYFRCLVRLARCRYEQQEYSLAQEILDDVKTLQADIFGDSVHPFVARMLQLQSEIFRRLGRFAEALEAIDQAIAMKKAIYGTEDHPSVAEALEVKVQIFHHLGVRDEAKLLIERTLEIRRKAYGENHPEMGRSIHGLGAYYLRLGQYAEAIEQFERARQIMALVFDKSHPDYIERTLNLANARNEQGEYQLALDLVAEVEATLPKGDHYLTARWLQLMSELQRHMGNFDIAMNYIDMAIAMKEAIYGTGDHPSVAEALEIKTKIFHHRGESVESRLLIDRALEIRRKAYGENHPEVSRSIHNLGSYYLRLGQYEEAAYQFERARRITVAIFGKRHPDYIERTLNLANARNGQGEYQLALSCVDEALESLTPQMHSDKLADIATENDWRLALIVGQGTIEAGIYKKSSEYPFRTSNMSNLRDWLRALVNGGHLTQTDREIAKRVLESLKTVSTDLVDLTKKYLSSAGTEVSQNDVDSLLCGPRQGFYPISPNTYVRLVAERVAQRDDIDEITQACRKLYGDRLSDRVALIVIDHTPAITARMQIYTYQISDHFTIVLLAVSQVRQALQTNDCSNHLDSILGENLGKHDLYNTKRPVSDVLEFYGRKHLIDTIQNNLDHGEHLAVLGLRKMGKTSLMNYLHYALPYPIAILSLQDVKRPSDIYRQTISRWNNALSQRVGGVRVPELVLTQNGIVTKVKDAFRSDSEKLLEWMQKNGIPPRLVLCLDEIDEIYPPDASSSEHRNMFAFFRSVADQSESINLIVCGMGAEINRKDYWGQKTNPVFQAFKELFLGPFSEEESNEMVLNIGAGMGVDYTEDALQYLYEQSGGHPFITRQMCSLAVKKADWPNTKLKKDDIVSVARDYLHSPETEAYIAEELWGALHDEVEMGLLKDLAQHQPQTENELIPESFALSQKQVRKKALSKLYERRLLNLNGNGYVIAYTCYRRWIRLNHLEEWENA